MISQARRRIAAAAKERPDINMQAIQTTRGELEIHVFWVSFVFVLRATLPIWELL